VPVIDRARLAEWLRGADRREEAVLSELVSEAKFPASRENTGNFIDFGLGHLNLSSKRPL
jgi:hypothetical protein